MYILIKTSTDSLDTANNISDELLRLNLSPCVQIYKSKSKYIWNGKINNSFEFIIEIKTIIKHKNKISKLIKKIHNYDIPEIITSNINILDNDYEKWFNENI